MQKRKFKIGVFLCLLILILPALLSCAKEDDWNNPLDPQNSDPFNLRATPLNGAIRLDWDAVKHKSVRGYVVFRSITIDSDYIEISPTLIEDTTYTDTDVSYGTTYYYKVAASDGTKISRFSLPVSSSPLGGCSISSIGPTTGCPGDAVTITGSGFGPDTGTIGELGDVGYLLRCFKRAGCQVGNRL